MVNEMNDLTNLFSTRLSRHAGQLLKYLRLVFTDHFVIALFFFFGALGFAYQNELKQLVGGVWWGPLVTVVILTLTTQVGRLATLIEPADIAFLMPAEGVLHDYLRSARNYSLLMGGLIQIAVVVILLPFMGQADQLSLPAATIVILTALVTKAAWMNLALKQTVQQTRLTPLNFRLVNWLMPLVIFASGLWLHPIIGLMLSIIGFSIVTFRHTQQWQRGQLAWTTLVRDEAGRMMGLYRFFNLFTDVPQVAAKIRRRRYLDPLWRWVNRRQADPYLYLFTRGLGRDSDTFGLITRLSVIGLVALIFIHQQWASLLVMILLVYLIGFQLLPFYRQYERNVFTHLYPITRSQQLQAFQKVLILVLTIVALVFVLTDTLVNWSWTRLLIDSGTMVLEVGLFVGWYSQFRLKKM